MATMNDPAQAAVVFGIYPSAFDAECGAADLICAEFSSKDISVLVPDQPKAHWSFHRTVAAAANEDSAAGGLLIGALGILAGMGSIAISGVGPLIVAGPLAEEFAKSGAAGSLVRALVGAGIPDYEARRYEGLVRDGGTLLSVSCDSAARAKRARQVLHSSGALDVATESRAQTAELALV